MDYSKLIGKIIEKFGTRANFAKALGISSVTLHKKLKGKVEWGSSEMVHSCELLEIPLAQAHEYFFWQKN